MCLTHYDEKLHERTLLREGREEGLAEGQNQERLHSIRALMENLHFSLQQAMDALSIPAAQQESYRSLLGQ